MSFLQLKAGIQLHYRDEGQGKPIVFIPGLAATLETWNYQVPTLIEAGFRCICIDMRGHGDSDKPYSKYNYNEMCSDIQALMEFLDLKDVTLVGWSMGAGISLNYANHTTDFNDSGRVAKLVMVGPATPCFLATSTEPYGMGIETAKQSLEGLRAAMPETMAAFADINFYRTDMEATSKWFLSLWLKMPTYVGYKCFEALMTEDLRGVLDKVTIPTLVCHGRHDQVCDPKWSEYMAVRLTNCDLIWFENSGHALMVEESDKLSQHLVEFAGK